MARPDSASGKGEGDFLLSVVDLVHHFQPSVGVLEGRGHPVQAVRGVSFDLRQGECLALVGESGSGKTTIARCLLRLVEPIGGNVLYRGESVLDMDAPALRDFRRRAQIVFQDPDGALNPRQRAGWMLEEVLGVHRRGCSPGERRARAAELLRMVGLPPEHRERYPHELSGGQRQRLGIARALAVGAELLILDEPVSALDLSIRAQILHLLGDLRARLGLSMILVAHDLSVVRQLADRVAVLYLGVVVEIGPSEALFEDPRHPYTRGLLAAAEGGLRPGVDRSGWMLLAAEPPSPRQPPSGCALHARCPHPHKDEECLRASPFLEQTGELRGVACWKESCVSTHP
jgi:peptide/nickel transport system ATP-binding protein